jgi:hypothetical protein
MDDQDLDRLALGEWLERFNCSPEAASVVNVMLGRVEAYVVTNALAVSELRRRIAPGSERDKEGQALCLTSDQIVIWLRQHRASLARFWEKPARSVN